MQRLTATGEQSTMGENMRPLYTSDRQAGREGGWAMDQPAAVRQALPLDAPAYWPIESYLAVGDLRTVALVAPDGSLDWLCIPRFDGPSVFGRLLDQHRGGAFMLRPTEPAQIARGYRDGTNVIDCVVETPSGEWILTDWMTLDPGPVRVCRRIEVVRGTARLRVSVAPRPGYGKLPGDPVRVGDTRWEWTADGVSFYLLSEVALGSDGPDVVGDVVLKAGDVRTWTFGIGSGEGEGSGAGADTEADLAKTVQWWRNWIGTGWSGCHPGPHAESLKRSALTLKLLTYAPTGAIVAAPTTSLPEDPGGVRNWDYRFTWLRDASMTITALNSLGHRDESQAFFRWMLTCCAIDRIVLHPVVPGSPVAEWEHPTWEGYGGARPVRIGNAAASQRQLDVYGEVLDAAWQYFQRDASEIHLMWPFLSQLAEEAAVRWESPDEGIWETRGAPQHFTYSKAQCWVALDRAVRMARRWDLPAPLDRWNAVAATIQNAVLTEGYNPRTGGFMQTLGGTTWDASALLLPQLGIVSPQDPRMRATVAGVRKHLAVPGDPDGVFLFRYRDLDDGLAGGEHAFLLCSAWLIATLALSGEHHEARRLLDRLVGISPFGLYAEEYDPVTGRFWGNFPQAFTHLGLLGAILHVAQADSPTLAGPLAGCRGWPDCPDGETP